VPTIIAILTALETSAVFISSLSKAALNVLSKKITSQVSPLFAAEEHSCAKLF
jgi:hypothetical protein